MSSVDQAQKIIFIDGSRVDVRAYKAFAEGGIDKMRLDEIRRSVFLGGLSKG